MAYEIIKPRGENERYRHAETTPWLTRWYVDEQPDPALTTPWQPRGTTHSVVPVEGVEEKGFPAWAWYLGAAALLVMLIPGARR